VVNKYDLNTAKTKEIEKYCRKNGVAVAGKIPFSEKITEALMRGKTIFEYKESDPAAAIISEINKKIWDSVEE